MKEITLNSELTLQRPDIWLRALDLATSLTGMIYEPKLPGPNGEMLACGVYREPTKKERENDITNEIAWKKLQIERLKKELEDVDNLSPNRKKKIEDDIAEWGEAIEKAKQDPDYKASVAVPEGEMEWLLHEVGHWVAATPAERALPNYGYGSSILLNGVGAAREWQAWGFEEIILAPFGTPRLLASPSQQDGVAFDKAGPMPYVHAHYAEQRIRELGVQVEQWRAVWGDWAAWRSATKH